MEKIKSISSKLVLVAIIGMITFTINFRINEDIQKIKAPIEKEVIIKKIYLKPDTIIIIKPDTLIKSDSTLLQKQTVKKPDLKLLMKSKELHKKPFISCGHGGRYTKKNYC